MYFSALVAQVQRDRFLKRHKYLRPTGEMTSQNSTLLGLDFQSLTRNSEIPGSHFSSQNLDPMDTHGGEEVFTEATSPLERPGPLRQWRCS